MNPNRQPAGIPAGGQFAPGFHPESTLALDGDEPGLAPEQSLGDVSNVREGSRTPWGTADWVSHVAPGAVQVSTAGHGGIKLSPERNKMIPTALRNAFGWYEEDCEAGIVAWFHPDACPQKGQSAEDVSESGRQTTINWFPNAYEAATGDSLHIGQSYIRDQDIWHSAHAKDEVAVSATRSPKFSGFTEVTVRQGGRAAEGSAERVLMVPSEEYNDPAHRHPIGRYAGCFVADPDRSYADVTPPPAPPKPPRPRYREVATSGLTPAQRARAESEMARRWRTADGEVRSLAEIISGGGIVGKSSVSADSRGRRTYYLRYATEAEGAPDSSTTYALEVSKATWDAIAAPDE